MKQVALTSLAMLSALAALAQNHITISQQGSSGNQASISQSGQGNQVHINQSGSTTGDSSSQPGNRVSLRVDSTTQTTISQHGPGPHRIELIQDGQATTIINSSSGTHDSTMTTFPGQENVSPRPRHPKRPHRR